MSTVRSDLTNSRKGNYSFANHNEDHTFTNVSLPRNKRPNDPSPSKLHKHTRETRQYELNRENIVPNQPPYTLPPSILMDDINTLQFLQDEVRRLEEVIFYIGTSNDKLIIDCDQKQKEIAFLKICSQKYKEEAEAEIRKLKELFNDKASECDSFAKNARRDKESYQQEAERLKLNLKTVIQKKNDELFNLTRERDRENHTMRKELQNSIEQSQIAHKKELQEKTKLIDRLNEEVSHWKQKHEKASQQYTQLDEQFQRQKIKMFEENQANVSQLKQKYYRNKLLLIETSQEEVRILEESSHLQRDLFVAQIEKLREHNERALLQNGQLAQIHTLSNQNHQRSMSQQQALVKNLKQKIDSVYKSKQQQIEMLKVKVGVLHNQNLRAVQNIYAARIHHLQDRVRSLSSQIERLQQVLKRQLQKNNALALKLRKKQAQVQEELAKMKVSHSAAEQALRLKFQTQKSMIMQHSAQVIKNYESKASNFQFYEQELRKLRSNLADKTKECDQQEDNFNQRTLQWQRQRQQLLRLNKNVSRILEETNAQIQGQLQSKNQQIQRLNQKIISVIRENPLPDYGPFEKQIDDLKKRLMEKTDSENSWRQRLDSAQKKCRQYCEQLEKLHLEAEIIINQAKTEWQSISQQRIADLQQFYSKKLALLQSEKEQLKCVKAELQNKITLLIIQYKELQGSLSEVMSSLKKRSELEEKVMQLGLDANLVKNKQQLFEC